MYQIISRIWHWKNKLMHWALSCCFFFNSMYYLGRKLQCCCSVAQSSPTLCNPMDCSTPDFPVLHHLQELAQIYVKSVMLSNHLILCHPLLLLCHPLLLLPSVFPSMGSFLMSQLFTSGGQSIGASTSASVLPMNIQDWFPLGLTGLISF